jgi:hypothetical protein
LGSQRFQLSKDRCHDRIRVLQHFIVRNTQDSQAEFLQAPRAFGVARDASRIGVLTAVQLDHQIRLEANKIDDISANRMLSPELKAEQLFSPQQTPQFPLGIGGLGAKTSGEGSQSWRPIVTSEHGNRIACSADASRTPTPTLPLGTGGGGKGRVPQNIMAARARIVSGSGHWQTLAIPYNPPTNNQPLWKQIHFSAYFFTGAAVWHRAVFTCLTGA